MLFGRCERSSWAWSPEDRVGPFGFFKKEGLLNAQMDSLIAEGDLDSVENGFTLWLGQGPVEFQGPLSKHHIRSLNLEHCIRMLQGKVTQALEDDFQKDWLFHFATQLSSNKVRINNWTGAETDPYVNLTQAYSERAASRSGFKKALLWCEHKGVEVHEVQKITAIDTFSDKLRGLRFNTLDGKDTKISSGLYVWMLSSAESDYLHSKGLRIFRDKCIEPEWAWVRSGFELSLTSENSQNQFLQEMPKMLAVLNDYSLPYTHENFMVLHQVVGSKPGASQRWNVWMRVPESYRDQEEYMKSLLERARKVLDDLLPGANVKVSELPVELRTTPGVLGPRPFSLYELKTAERIPQTFKRLALTNVDLQTPETWQLLDWPNMIKSQMSSLEWVKAQREALVETPAAMMSEKATALILLL